jgi:hypothetical protein
VKRFLSIFLVLCVVPPLMAADFIVTNTNDSGPGSLRQAITDANNSQTTPSRVVKFQIPGPGVHTINLVSALPAAFGIIDGYTQPGARPNSLAVGTDAVLLVEINASAVPNRVALQFAGSRNGTVRGLVLNGNVSIQDAGSNQISGCYIGTDASGMASTAFGGSVTITSNDFVPGNTIGGTTPADRNVVATSITISANAFLRYGFNAIQGNYVGVAADGKSFLNPDAFVFLSHSDTNTIGGSTAGAGNVIAGNLSLSSSSKTLVQGNLIGTTGMDVSPGAEGLSLSGNPSGASPGSTSNNTVLQNVIVGSDKVTAPVGLGIASGNNVLKGNLIGVGTDGKTRLGNCRQGIVCSASFYRSVNNTIGGPNPGDGNIIMFGSTTDSGTASSPPRGIVAIPEAVHNIISGNSISGPGGLGIDLGAKGVTPNDPGDADGIQNYPVLTSAAFANGNVRVTGTLNSLANTAFRIELFGNDTADGSGYGQGRSYLGFTGVTTDDNGNALFEVTLPVPVSTRAISSTATGPLGTSEFSGALFAKLLNISTRANVQTGENIAIAGFIITGADAKKVLLRGIGPSLAIEGTLNDPMLDVWDSSNNLLAENDNWRDSQRSEIQATGLAPTNFKESAVLLTLSPGAYTVQLSGIDEGTGIGLVEVYDLTQLGSQLANISTRSRVETEDSVMIAGCIMAPDIGRSGRILVRGIGPSLSDVAEPLSDPVVELHDTNGLLLAANDDWKSNQADVQATGIAPTDDRESALVAELVPSNYTVVLRGKNNLTGVAVIEVYRLP